MPVRRGLDSKGCYYRFGETGKKYYYECGNEAARKRALAKAEEQAKAIRASGYEG